MGLVLGYGPRRARGAPRHRPVIGPLGADDRLAAGVGARDHQGHQGRVGPVLAEHRPVGVRDHGDQGLGQIDHHPARPGHGVAPAQLVDEGAVDHLVAVADQIGAIGAHEIEQFGPVGVPKPGALCAGEELGIVIRQQADRLVTIHSARNDRLGPFAKGSIQGIGPHDVDSQKG